VLLQHGVGFTTPPHQLKKFFSRPRLRLVPAGAVALTVRQDRPEAFPYDPSQSFYHTTKTLRAVVIRAKEPGEISFFQYTGCFFKSV
jgi:hypothetical protein